MTSALEAWWRRSFRALLARELRGDDPRRLEARWLVLDRRSWNGPRQPFISDVPAPISHFLDDADIRAKDPHYARRQWAQALEWLNG